MTVREWYKQNSVSDSDPETGEFEIAYVIETDGRGEAYLEELGDDRYGAYMTDDELNLDIRKPGESLEAQVQRVNDETEMQIFKGTDDIELVAKWFVEQVGYSDSDKQKILQEWRAKQSA